MKTNICPTAADLSAFAIGNLPGEALEAVAEHATGCERCSSTLDALADTTDSLLKELRRPVETDTADDAEVRRVVTLIERIGSSTGSPAASPTLATGEAPTASFRPEPEFGRLGQYELLEKLGDGGMGQVYKARHALMDRIVAIKVIHKEHLAKPENVLRFQREIRALAQLDHPNIVRAEYADQAGDTHFLVMEYVEGVNLHRLVKERGPLPIAEACEYIRQAAAGLAHAHERGLVHRDIKPSNLLVGSGQWVVGSQNAQASSLPTTHCPLPTLPLPTLKILDLGLALLRDNHPGQDELTTPGQVLGTLDYMAPEQWDDTHKVDHRADLYSLGCTLYYLLAGTPPFGGPEYQSARQKMKAHLTAPPPSIRERRPDVPEHLAKVLERMLAKEPAERFATAAEVAGVLQGFTMPAPAGQPVVENRPAVPAPQRKKARTVRFALALGPLRVKVAFALGLLLAVGFALPFWMANQRHGAPESLAKVDESKEKPGPFPDPAVVMKDVDSVKLQALVANWGKLGREEQIAALQQFLETEKIPATHREVIESYLQSLQKVRMASKRRIDSFRLSHYRGDPAVPLGEIGKSTFTARLNDDLRIHAEYPDRFYSYLIAFNPDGKEQVCCSNEPTAATKTAFEYPANGYFGLTDGVGMQALVLLGFRDAVPPYEKWKAGLGAAPWRAFQAEGVWRFDGESLQLLTPQERGPTRDRRGWSEIGWWFSTSPSAGLAGLPWAGIHANGPPGPPRPLVELCNFFKNKSGADIIQVIAFPVKAK